MHTMKMPIRNQQARGETKLDTENAGTHNIVYPKQDAVVSRQKQINRPEIVLKDIFWGIESSGKDSRPPYENEQS